MQQSSIITQDGVTLATYHWATDGEYKHIFLVHGMGEHAQRYCHVAEFLHAEGYAVHAFDQRGHGQSDGKRGHVPRWESLAHDLYQLTSQYAGSKFVLGHSMGGAVAVLSQLLYPHSIDSLALSGPATDVSLPISGWKVLITAALSRIWPSISLSNSIDPELVCADPAVVRSYRADPLVHNKISARFLTDYLRSIQYIKKQAHEIRTPVAIWHGAEDKIVEPWISADLFARLRCPAKQREVMDGLYHEILFEKNGLKVAIAMLKWFEETRIREPETKTAISVI